MIWKRNSREWIAVALIVLAVASFISSLRDTRALGDPAREARRVERVLARHRGSEFKRKRMPLVIERSFYDTCK